jgi:hypothetical protein
MRRRRRQKTLSMRHYCNKISVRKNKKGRELRCVLHVSQRHKHAPSCLLRLACGCVFNNSIPRPGIVLARRKPPAAAYKQSLRAMEQLRWFVSASACERDRSGSLPRTSWIKQPDSKSYPIDLQRIDLPSLQACLSAEPQAASCQLVSSLCRVAPGARSSCSAPAASPLSLARVTLLLQLSFGITGNYAYKRAAPSSGGLCPSELFVFWNRSLYHFSADSSQLTQVRSDHASCEAALHSLLPYPRPASCVFFVASNLHRTGTKYFTLFPQRIFVTC